MNDRAQAARAIAQIHQKRERTLDWYSNRAGWTPFASELAYGVLRHDLSLSASVDVYVADLVSPGQDLILALEGLEDGGRAFAHTRERVAPFEDVHDSSATERVRQRTQDP